MAMPDVAVETPGRAFERLDFVLPDFARHMWVSAEAREVWGPRLQQAVAAWLDIEWLAVLEGVRTCAATFVTPQQFAEQGARWAERGLNALPVEMVASSSQSYSASSSRPEPGQPFAYRFVVGAPSDVVTFKRAWDAADQEAIGGLLGYPACCQEFFRRVWVDEGMVDTTWPMAQASDPIEAEDGALEVEGPLEANILGRWLGIRAVPHLPCSFHCEATVRLGTALLDIGAAAGFTREVGWIRELLSWPVEWSALHGIGEIRTPIAKMSIRTDATAGKHVVRRRSDAYPPDGVDGLFFPYRRPVRQRLTDSAGFRRGIAQPVEIRRVKPSWYFTDNGFTSLTDMETAHRPVVDAAIAALDGTGGKVLDLGCGNGALLQRICRYQPEVEPVGVDFDPQAIEHARELHGGQSGRFVVGDMFAEGTWPVLGRYRLVLIMPGRLLEVSEEQAARLRRRLREAADAVVVYAYGDWLDRYGGLAELAAEAGFLVEAADWCSAAIAYAEP